MTNRPVIGKVDMETATLCRTKRGTMVHRSNCQKVSGVTSHAKPWLWADTVPLEEVAKAVCQFGYTTCHYCKPIPGELIGRHSI